jgi:hypothetical protein
MLTIKDLASATQLRASDMSALRGGSNINVLNSNFAFAGGFGSPAAVIAPVAQVDASAKTTNSLLQNFGRFQLAEFK